MASVVANLPEGPQIENSLGPRKWKFASGHNEINEDSGEVIWPHSYYTFTEYLIGLV